MKTPGLYKFLFIVGIIIGGFGTLNGFFGTIAAVTPGFNQLGSKFLDSMAQTPEMRKELEANLNFQKNIEEVMDRWRPYTGATAFYGLLASLFLLIASIQLMKFKDGAPGRFRLACLASIPKTIAATIVNAMVQAETIAVANQWMSTLFSEFDDEPMAFMNKLMNIVKAGGLVFAMMLAVAALIYYLAGIIYMGKPIIRQLYANPPLQSGAKASEGP